MPAVVALAPAPAQDEQPLVPLLGGAAPAQAPDAAPAPTPAPPLSVECSDSGSSNRESPAIITLAIRLRDCCWHDPKQGWEVLAEVDSGGLVMIARLGYPNNHSPHGELWQY